MSLTSAEHEAMRLSAELWNTLAGIVGDGPTRDADLGELAAYIHAIQRAVLSQAAGRAHPDQYRLLGHTLPADAAMNPPADQPGTGIPLPDPSRLRRTRKERRRQRRQYRRARRRDPSAVKWPDATIEYH